MEQGTYIASEENSMVSVCAVVSSGTSERGLLVTLITEGSTAEGTHWESVGQMAVQYMNSPCMSSFSWSGLY